MTGCMNQAERTEKFRASCMTVAEEYVISQLDSTKKEETKGGVILIGNKNKTYVLDPAKIYAGKINSDNEDDAVITLDTFTGEYQTMSEQLILISYKHKPALNRVIESDMKILAVKDGLIIAEVPEHSRNSPLFNCPSCREIIKYRFQNGELIKKEE